MNAILIKLFATALTLSQVTTRPDAVKTQFDAVADRAEVTKILRDGCAHMRKAFDIEDLNLDELIATAMDDPQAVAGNTKILQGLDLRDLHGAYREFCKNETVTPSSVDLGEVIAYYNKATAELPDHARLKGGRLPGASLVLDGRGERFAELYEPDNRRLRVPLADIPEHVRQAFVAGEDVTYERKIREMIVASRLERAMTKPEILELYLNTIYLGRASWGVEMAARSWFSKTAKDLTLAEGALLAGLTKGPNYYSPDRYPERAQERIAYVMGRLKEEGVAGVETLDQNLQSLPQLIAYERPRRDVGFHFVDQVA